MPEPELISVIIPTYNRADLLLQALDSVRRQTWPNIQIIVADDGSTDNTAELVSTMEDVCYVHQENRGQASARNLGLKCAVGDYICSLDSDDLWEDTFLEHSLNALHALNADFVFSNWMGETAEGDRYPSYFEEVYGWSDYAPTALEGWRVLEPHQVRHIYTEACLSPSSSLLLPKRFFSHGWVETFKIADDWCLLLDAVLNTPCRVAVSTRPRWIKRVVGDNIYDQHDFMEVKRDFYVHDFRMILERFSSVMTANERALFYTRLAFHQFGLARCQLLMKRQRSAIPGLVTSAAISAVRAVFISPRVVLARARASGDRRRKPEQLELAKVPVESTTIRGIVR